MFVMILRLVMSVCVLMVFSWWFSEDVKILMSVRILIFVVSFV